MLTGVIFVDFAQNFGFLNGGFMLSLEIVFLTKALSCGGTEKSPRKAGAFHMLGLVADGLLGLFVEQMNLGGINSDLDLLAVFDVLAGRNPGNDGLARAV